MSAPPATPGRRFMALPAVVCAAWLVAGAEVAAQSAPAVVPQLDLRQLDGDWYEIATTGSPWHRRCVSDTRYRFVVSGVEGLGASSICTTPRGVESHRGRLRAGRHGDGRLSLRFGPVIFAWLPATWSDFWLLAVAEDFSWLLVGDNRRDRLSILSRRVALDEASIASAIAAARRRDYDPARMAPVPHPAGPSGLLPPR